jgi:hypothetical protein
MKRFPGRDARAPERRNGGLGGTAVSLKKGQFRLGEIAQITLKKQAEKPSQSAADARIGGVR